jgi:hypothetical protein
LARCEEGVDHAGPEEEECEEDEFVLLGREGDISNLGAPLWMQSTTSGRVRPRTP